MSTVFTRLVLDSRTSILAFEYIPRHPKNLYAMKFNSHMVKTIYSTVFDWQCIFLLGLGDCVNFTIMIIVIKTSRFPIISNFVVIQKITG